MTATIQNAAPMTRLLGTQDMSTRPPVAEPLALPQHLPKIYFYAEKGPTTPQLAVGAARTALYGVNSFDLRKPYANHQTVLANTINAQGNAGMYERLKPNDAPPPATIRLMLDVLPTQVPVYERHSDGAVKLDGNGQPKATGETIAGFKVKFVRTQVTVDADGNSSFGAATQEDGDQVENGVQSTRFPIVDSEVSSFGKYGNDLGLRLWAPTTKSSSPMDSRMLSQQKVFPIRMACVQRPSPNSTVKVVETLSGEQYVNTVLKPETLDGNDDLAYVGDRFIQAYQLVNRPGYAPVYGPFGRMHVYSDVIEELLQMFYAAEAQFIDAFSDFQGDADEHHMFNLIGGVSSANVPYRTYQFVSAGSDTVRLSENSTIFAAGGGDGTMNDELYAQLVIDKVVEYANPNSNLMDTAKYPESIIYDSGLPLEGKKALCSFIAERKDTFVVLSTHTVGQPVLSASEDSALAVALRTRLQMYPESEYFGTPVMRGAIVGRSGSMLNSQFKKPLPLAINIAAKCAAYMGAGNGQWVRGAGFDEHPLNEVDMFTDINVTFTPVSVRNKDWAAGLIWVESFDLRSVYFPAFHTVYDDDSSVLTGMFTALACVELQKVGDRSRRKFSGRSNLTNAQFVEAVNDYITEAVEGRFDGRFIIRPVTTITSADEQRGYSWTTAIQIYAPNMKTVGTLSVEAYRIEDLAQ